jgi:hypothetical protein
MADAQEWARRRREAAQEHADRLARRRAAETARASEMIHDFAREAQARGIAAAPLLARAGDRKPTYRTGLIGWYLTRDGSLGVTTDGDYYHLAAPRSLKSQLFGVRLEPAEPPLQVGAGARDGESMGLDVLLAMRLNAGNDWPIHGL